MADITIRAQGSTIGDVSFTATYNEADSDKLTAYLAATYGTDEEGNQRTIQQMFDAASAALVAGFEANVYRWQQQEAAKQAAAAVEPMQKVE